MTSGQIERPTNLYGMSREQLALALRELDAAPYRAGQVFAWLYARDVLDPLQWTDLARPLREAIAARFRSARPTIERRVQASDGTTKYTLALPEGGSVEAVAIPADERMTFCISSQVGCAFGCTFCMTATLGFQRNLHAGEIVGQVAALAAEAGVAAGEFNVVFMGMGEPLHNLESVLAALRLLTDEKAFALGPRRITVSTVGLPKGIARLAAEPIVPRLAVSLVTAHQATRESLMPIAKRVSLDELAEAIRLFALGKRDVPTLECVMLAGVNDHPWMADELARLARRARAKVNLIEFNPTPELPYQPASEGRIQHFLRVLTENGVTATVRRSRGKDAFAACGQLAFLEAAR